MTRHTTDNQIRRDFAARLRRDAKYRDWALVEIYDDQTPEEKFQGRTIARNERGFNGLDGRDLSHLAKKVLRGERLCPNESFTVAARLAKYWRNFVALVEPDDLPAPRRRGPNRAASSKQSKKEGAA